MQPTMGNARPNTPALFRFLGGIAVRCIVAWATSLFNLVVSFFCVAILFALAAAVASQFDAFDTIGARNRAATEALSVPGKSFVTEHESFRGSVVPLAPVPVAGFQSCRLPKGSTVDTTGTSVDGTPVVVIRSLGLDDGSDLVLRDGTDCVAGMRVTLHYTAFLIPVEGIPQSAFWMSTVYATFMALFGSLLALSFWASRRLRAADSPEAA